jgi:hypothetical protein
MVEEVWKRNKDVKLETVEEEVSETVQAMKKG